jgi:hypothetical protein
LASNTDANAEYMYMYKIIILEYKFELKCADGGYSGK